MSTTTAGAPALVEHQADRAAPSAALDERARQIREELAEVEAAFAAWAERAIRLGALLIRTKAEVEEELGWGRWAAWVRANVPRLGEREERRYRQIASAPEELRSRMTGMTLTAALRLLAEPEEAEALADAEAEFCYGDEPVQRGYAETEEQTAARDKSDDYEREPPEPMREVRILVTKEQHEELAQRVRVLRRAWRIDISDEVVLRAVREAYERIPADDWSRDARRRDPGEGA